MAENLGRPERFPGHTYPQIIPVPDQIIDGDHAPWAALPESERSGFTLEKVQNRLRDAHRWLDADPIPEEPLPLDFVSDAAPTTIAKRSAVLVLLFEEEGECSLVLTRRTQTLRTHQGQVSFPGGRQDEGETPIETALRETEEEVGVERTSVTPFGWLTPLVSFGSFSWIRPIVGSVDERPLFTVSDAEVDRVFTVRIRDLLEEGAFLSERWQRHDVSVVGTNDFFPIYFYKVPGDLVWGATARMLTELLCLLTDTPWPERSGLSKGSTQ